MTVTIPTHDELEEHYQEELDWPQYFHHYHPDHDDLADVYYRLDGPNGPAWSAWFLAEGVQGPEPRTLRMVIMEASSGPFERVQREETPFEELEERDIHFDRSRNDE